MSPDLVEPGVSVVSALKKICVDLDEDNGANSIAFDIRVCTVIAEDGVD